MQIFYCRQIILRINWPVSFSCFFFNNLRCVCVYGDVNKYSSVTAAKNQDYHQMNLCNRQSAKGIWFYPPFGYQFIPLLIYCHNAMTHKLRMRSPCMSLAWVNIAGKRFTKIFNKLLCHSNSLRRCNYKIIHMYLALEYTERAPTFCKYVCVANWIHEHD